MKKSELLRQMTQNGDYNTLQPGNGATVLNKDIYMLNGMLVLSNENETYCNGYELSSDLIENGQNIYLTYDTPYVIHDMPYNIAGVELRGIDGTIGEDSSEEIYLIKEYDDNTSDLTITLKANELLPDDPGGDYYTLCIYLYPVE